MPNATTIFDWLRVQPAFAQQYVSAREAQADALVEECLEIADDGKNDWMERRSAAEKGRGIDIGWVLNGEHIQRSKLRCDQRKWWAARIAPKKYGDKMQHSGDAENPIKVKHDVELRPQLSRDEWEKRNLLKK